MSKNDVTDLSLQRFIGGYFKSIQYFQNDKPVIFGGIIDKIHFDNGHIKIIHLSSGEEIEMIILSCEFIDLPKMNKIVFRSVDQAHDLILMDTSVN